MIYRLNKLFILIHKAYDIIMLEHSLQKFLLLPLMPDSATKILYSKMLPLLSTGNPFCSCPQSKNGLS